MKTTNSILTVKTSQTQANQELQPDRPKSLPEIGQSLDQIRVKIALILKLIDQAQTKLQQGLGGDRQC